MAVPPDPSEQKGEQSSGATGAAPGSDRRESEGAPTATAVEDPSIEGPPGSATGLFGRPLVVERGRSAEPAPVEILTLLTGEEARDPDAKTVEVVRFRAADGRVEYSADLSGLVPILESELSPTDRVAVVARVASALTAMHAAGLSHGDLGPWSIRVGKGRVVLLTPPPGVRAGALIEARVRHAGAPLSDAAYCSGGALAKGEGGPANDVYALAGVAHRLISGDLPVGHVDVSAAAHSPLRDLAAIVFAGLAAIPSQRPRMTAFEQAAWRTVHAEPPTPWSRPPEQLPVAAESMSGPREAQAPSGADVPAARPANMPVGAASTPVAPAVRRPEDPAGNREYSQPVFNSRPGSPPPGAGLPQRAPELERRQLSSVLTLLLVVGGLFVLVGALWIVAVGWAILGEGGRAALLFALTAGIATGGFALEKKGFKSSGFALVVLASQMLWADGGYILSLGDALSSVGAWSAVAGFVTAVSALLAIRRRSLGAGVLAAIGFAVFAVCFNVATGRPGQLAFFSGLTLSALLGGVLAVRKERPVLGTALLVTGAQLLWIDAGCFLDLVTLVDSEGAWTLVAALVFGATAAIAAARRSIAGWLFAAFDFIAFAALFAHLTGRPGQLGLAVAVTATLAIAGQRQSKKGNPVLAEALTLGATQLLWADAALLLDLLGVAGDKGPWSLAAATITAVTYGVTLARCPAGALLAAIDASVLAGLFGAYLSRGEPLGPPIYTLAVAGFFAVLAAGAHRAKRPAGSGLFAGFGVLYACSSAALAVELLDRESHVLFGSLWPVVPVVCLAPFAFRGRAGSDITPFPQTAGGLPHRPPWAGPGAASSALAPEEASRQAHQVVARIGVALLLGGVPVAQALQRPGDPVYVVNAAILGSVASFVALRSRVWWIQAAGGLITLVNAVLVPSTAFLDKGLNEGGLALLTGPSAPYLFAALGAPVALLLIAAFASPADAPADGSPAAGPRPPKVGHRAVEIAALLQLFGLTTIASLVRSSDFFYPAVILATGTFALALGGIRRHVVVVAIASGALLLNLWIQYFQKLRDTFPTAVLVIGFGIGLLVAGVVYERAIRRVLPRLKDWS